MVAIAVKLWKKAHHIIFNFDPKIYIIRPKTFEAFTIKHSWTDLLHPSTWTSLTLVEIIELTLHLLDIIPWKSLELEPPSFN